MYIIKIVLSQYFFGKRTVMSAPEIPNAYILRVLNVMFPNIYFASQKRNRKKIYVKLRR